MASRNAGSVVIRLDLRGQEELKRRLDELGPAGERLGRDLSKAMQPVQREGRLAKATLLELGDAVEDVAREAGPLGAVLMSIGPAGLAMAAGLGAAALALREVFLLMERSREVAGYAAQLDTVARVSGVAADRVMDFRTALRLADGEAEQADASLEKFAERLGEYRNTGQGEGRDAFTFLGLTGGDFDRLPVEDALDRVLDALREIEDPSRRLSLAEMLGLGDATPLLQRSAAEIERMVTRAQELNSALSTETLRAFAEAQREFNELAVRRERAEQLSARATLDLEIERQRLTAQGEEQRAAALSFLIPLEERERDVLRDQLELLEGQSSILLRLQPGPGSGVAVFADAARSMARWLGVTEELNEELARTDELVEAMSRPTDPFDPQSDFWVNNITPAPDRRAHLSLERRAELEALVASSLQGLMTPLEQVQQLEAELNAAREAYLSTGDEALRITEAQIASLVAEARERAGLVEGLDAELRLRQEIADMSRVVPRLRPDHPNAPKPEVDANAPGSVGNGIEDLEAQKAKAMADAYREALQSDREKFASTTADFVAQGVLAGAQRGWAGALEVMQRRLIAMLYDAIFESVRSGIMQAFASGGGGGGGFLPAFLPGFDRGADLLVGGRPGVDRNLVSINGQPAFRVSAGERMRVEPAMGRASGPGGVHQHFHLHAEGAVMTEELMQSLSRRADQSSAAAIQGAEALARQRDQDRFKASRYAFGRP
jgi:hypothetical protein